MKKGLFVSAAILVSFAAATPALAAEKAAELPSSAGIGLVSEPTDPEQPEGNNGNLNLNKVTAIDFGQQYISGSDAIYSAKRLETDKNEAGKNRANYIRVKDNRGTNKGWTLQVSNSMFKAGTEELKAAKLYLTATHVTNAIPDPTTGKLAENPVESTETITATDFTLNTKVELDGSDSAKNLASAKEESGMGYTNVYLGEAGAYDETKDQSSTAKNHSIQLAIPGTSKKDNGATYISTVKWSLLDEPSTTAIK